MNILVTGGSGLVGKYVVDYLASRHRVSILDIKKPATPHPFYWVDILNLPTLTKAFSHGFDAVVHMAGIPHPLNDPPQKVFTVNVLGTFNVLEASTRCGIGKVVFVSSESVLGLAFQTRPTMPEYIPIDENHPVAPQDPYGLSKLLGEEICRSYSARYPEDVKHSQNSSSGMKTICLRPAWIWVPEEREIEMYRMLVHEYPKWSKNLWAYVHVEDFAAAVLAALESESLGRYEIFFITANENWTGKESRALLQEHYPAVRNVADNFGGEQSLISSAKAKAKLGYVPRHTWRELIEPKKP